jgi:mRNA interferase RelE/StbE
MIVKIDRSFEKDTHKLKNDLVLVKIADCIENIQASEKVSDINGIKKLSGFKNFYRIKIRDYRIGLLIIGNTAQFIRCLHRKDIYRYFPK